MVSRKTIRLRDQVYPLADPPASGGASYWGP